MTVLCELGALGVETDGIWTEVSGPRMSTVVAALGLAGRSGVGTEALVEMTWPSPGQPTTARQSLANIVLRLRNAYGADFVESTSSGYRLGEGVCSDRVRFRAWISQAGELVGDDPEQALELAERALDRWRGEPWAGLERPIAVEPDRARMLQARLDARRIRAAALMGLHRWEHAVDDLTEVLDADPYDESVCHDLARTLAECGRRAEALTTIRQAHRILADRGLVPDAALLALERRLLDVDITAVADREPPPAHDGELVGRTLEIRAIAAAFDTTRLVTIHGIGGSGKTRLAVGAAHRLDDSVPPGFVDLAGAHSSVQVEMVFARGLGLPAGHIDGLNSVERRAALADVAAASSGVVIVDNCEHVVDDVRSIVAGLLDRRSEVRFLATSRVPLELSGEHRFPIPQFQDSAELFRRSANRHGVVIESAEGVELVDDICGAVDHLPLAIELAAAQTPYRTLREIVDELRRGVAHHDATRTEPRHETMSAAIRWSHGLLDPDSADAFVRLGVFDAPFELVDAEAVAGSGGARHLLDTLVRSSLVERAERGGRSEFRLTVPVRQYCAAELTRRGDATEVAVLLADWLLHFTDRPYGDVWWRFSVVDEIGPRFSHALTGVAALAEINRVDDAARLAARLGGVAHLFGRADELIDVVSDLSRRCTDDNARADALVARAMCADITRRGEVFSPSLGLLSALDGPAGRRHSVFVHCMNALVMMMVALLTDDDYSPAHAELERGRQLLVDRDSPIDRALIRKWQSAVHLLEGDWSAAEDSARRSLLDATGTVMDVGATLCLCHARLQLGDPDMALDLATNHPERHRLTGFGDRLGYVIAIALVQRGEVDAGLEHMAAIQRTALENSWAAPHDDVALSVAAIAHLLGHDDLVLEVLRTGATGFGPWMGYLVPKLRRDLGEPDVTRLGNANVYSGSSAEYYSAINTRILDELRRRAAAGPPP
jgi:predicted ATPase/DNA-binding SARP family transcriptional activator